MLMCLGLTGFSAFQGVAFFGNWPDLGRTQFLDYCWSAQCRIQAQNGLGQLGITVWYVLEDFGRFEAQSHGYLAGAVLG